MRDQFDLDALLDRVNAKPDETEEIPEPGSEGNPWIGMNRIVSGTRQFYAFSGAERRRVRRVMERGAAKEQKRGERAYNRQQRQQAFDAGTVRMQHRILSGDIKVSPDMLANLTNHVIRQTRLNERALTEPDRKEHKAWRRTQRLTRRRVHRLEAGKPRHADLVFAGSRES